MGLEQSTARSTRVVTQLVRWSVIVVMAVCVSALGGFWWLIEGMSLWVGTLTFFALTAFTFNRMPEAGMAWFLNKEVLFIRLPVWLINVVGYMLGFWFTT